MIVGIILTYKYRDKLKNWKYEKQFRSVLAFVMLMAEMGYFWRLLYAGSGNSEVHTLLTKLPVQVCEWTCIIAIFMVMNESKPLFYIDVFVCLTVGIVPLLTPAVISTTGPMYLRYYQFFLEHTLPIYSVFYMMFVHDFKFEAKSVYKPAIFLFILSIISIILNNKIEGANYLYLSGSTDGNSIANILPSNVYIRLLIYALIIGAIFAIEILIFHMIEKKKTKK